MRMITKKLLANIYLLGGIFYVSCGTNQNQSKFESSEMEIEQQPESSTDSSIESENGPSQMQSDPNQTIQENRKCSFLGTRKKYNVYLSRDYNFESKSNSTWNKQLFLRPISGSSTRSGNYSYTFKNPNFSWADRLRSGIVTETCNTTELIINDLCTVITYISCSYSHAPTNNSDLNALIFKTITTTQTIGSSINLTGEIAISITGSTTGYLPSFIYSHLIDETNHQGIFYFIGE